MNVKKIMVFMFAAIFLLLTIISSGCGSDDMNSRETSFNFFELIESNNLNDISLTIYYMDLFTRTRAPVTLEQLMGGWHDNSGQLINGWYDYKTVITGETLAKHRDLLNQLINIELISVANESFVNARLYYVFEHSEHGELFSFLAFSGSDDTVFINGREVKSNRIFYEIVLPFLPEDAIATIKTYLDAVWQ